MKHSIIFILPLMILFYGCSNKKEVCKSPEVLDLNNGSMSYIKGGEFLMGDYDDKFGDKMPREVYVKSFLIDRTEVTNAMYRAYISEKGCGVQKPTYIDDLVLAADNYPVVGVSYKEAKNFCKFYKKRLPTEAEWEYAARGGLEYKKYPWGDEESPKFMNYRDSKQNWASAVMSYMPNAYRLYDMSGNVREWVEDTYEKKFYKDACLKSPLKSDLIAIPKYGMEAIYKSNCYLNPVNRAKGDLKVNRGGSWEYSEGYPATVSFRSFDDKNHRARDLGFRCAVDAEKESWIEQEIKDTWVAKKIIGISDEDSE